MTTESRENTPSVLRAVYASLPKAVVSAGVLFFDDAGRVMLVRTTYKEHWEIPGGVVETNLGEQPVRAACREVAEEIGLTIAPPPLLTVDSMPATDERPAALAFVFDGGVLTTRQLENIQFLDNEIVEARFCEADQIRELAGPGLARRVLASIAARTEDQPRPVFLHRGT